MKTIIVTGMPRSGTSLTMQMLYAGGHPCVGEYPAFEHYELAQIDWSEVKGKAVKALEIHRQFPPKGDYAIIITRRDITEQAKSALKLISAFGNGVKVTSEHRKSLEKSLKKDYQSLMKWAQRYPHIVVDFEKTMKFPLTQATRISSFLGMELDVDKMVSAVVSRCPDNYNGLLELELINQSINP